MKTDSFCPDPLWNSSLSWYTDNPVLTQCMKDTILPALPCGLLWISAPIWFSWAVTHKSKLDLVATEKTKHWKYRLTRLFVAKFILNLLLLVNVCCQFAKRFETDRHYSDVFYFLSLTLSFLIANGMIVYEKVRHIRSSIVLSYFWPILFIVLVPGFKDDIEQLINATELSTKDLLLVLTLEPVVFLQVILCSFADTNDLNIEKPNLAPENMASFVSCFFISWMDPLMWRGYRKPLAQADLPTTPGKVTVSENVTRFLQYWEHHVKVYREKQHPEGSKRHKITLWKPLFQAFGSTFLWGNFLGLVHYSVIFISPQILRLLVNHVQDLHEESWKGYFYAVLLFASSVLNTMTFQHYVLSLVVVATQVRSGLVSAIIEKSLKLSNAARQKFTVGEITNYVSVDTQRLLDNISYLGVLWGAPYQVILAIVFLYIELGVASLAGLIGLAILMPLNAWGSKIGEKLQGKLLKAKDSRIKLMNELLAGMKVLKLYAWEIPFIKKIGLIRNREIKFLKYMGYLWTVINFTFSFSPFLITIGSFSVYVYLDPENNRLTPEKMFVSLSLFNLLRIPLTLFSLVLKEVIQMKVSMTRITNFMNAEELDQNSVEKLSDQQANDIDIHSASFSWGSKDNPTLKGINFNAPKGSLTAVVGVVGSGKSSLLSAILGEMEKAHGSANISGDPAYVPQQAWIQNMTLRDNILFAGKFEDSKYKRTIDACALKSDLNILTHGDYTEIGEHGINLSGGQKQRVSLARAVYSDKAIYLLDDPLSAVDSHVGQHIFDNILSSSTGLLKDRTRVWVMNQVKFLPHVDHIVVLKDGMICEQGTFQDLMTLKASLHDLVQLHVTSSSDSDDDNGVCDEDEFEKQHQEIKDDHYNEPDDGDGRLVEDETSLTGHVPLAVFMQFFKSVGIWTSLVLMIMFALEHAIHALGVVWLTDWSDSLISPNSTGHSSQYNLGIYTSISLVEAAVQISRDMVFYVRCAIASKIIHEALLHSIMRSPMSFFDTNPIGRIINRFSADVDTMDQKIPQQLADMLWCLLEVVVTLVIVSYTTPDFLYAVIPILLLFFAVQRFYVTTSRQLKRLYSVSKSPIFAHFSEIVNGAAVIRAYKQSSRFVQESQERVQENVKSHYLGAVSNRWLSIRMENAGNLVILLASAFAVANKGNLTAGMAALSITYAMNVTGSLVWMVRMACELENNSVSIERMVEYINNKHEAEWEEDCDVPEQWPDAGKVEFQDYQTRYREGHDLVLKGISISVQQGEKLGICGRTGAGKSSLTLALFRIIEPTGGRIVIDGLDIVKLGLHQLRSKLTIIPQDPVLFTGSLRFNLDPIGEHDDTVLWKSLELAHLKKHIVDNVSNGLDHEVREAGSNFSVGQRQLICLARALLCKTKILVLDEATAAVDPETDELIQSTIRTEFSSCTVLTIAHRLNTIMDSDRIAVLSQGRLEEIGKPKQLFTNSQSSFRLMAIDAGILKSSSSSNLLLE